MYLLLMKNISLLTVIIYGCFLSDCYNQMIVKGHNKKLVSWTRTQLKMIFKPYSTDAVKYQNETENEDDGDTNFKRKILLWPQGQISYFIDDFSFDKVLKTRLRGYLEEVGTQTGLQFVEMPQPVEDPETRWVLFLNRRGILPCQDYSTDDFTEKGVQRVVIGYDCMGPEGVGLSATVLALAGVPPQHNAPNRDQYISILQQNILPDKKHLFSIINEDEWPFPDNNYDFFSAGHYDFYKYTMNGLATILPRIHVNAAIGEGRTMSKDDIIKIKTLYKNSNISNNKSKICSQLFSSGKGSKTLKLSGGTNKHIFWFSDYNTSYD